VAAGTARYAVVVPFRDDREAARARIEQLEQELVEARTDLQARHAAETPRPKSRAAGVGWGAVALLLVALLLLGGAAYAGFGVADQPSQTVALALGVAGVLVLMVAMLRATLGLLLIAAPNELLVLSGRPSRLPDGRIVGYRIVRGGRALRLPFLERADWLDLTNQVILIEIPDCHAKDGTRVAIEALANVKIAGELPFAANAVERFLGCSRADVAEVARETLEGVVRGVVAGLSVAELRGAPTLAANRMLEEAEYELHKLGILVDTPKVKKIDLA
jgi:hypothetical protein